MFLILFFRRASLSDRGFYGKILNICFPAWVGGNKVAIVVPYHAMLTDLNISSFLATKPLELL